MFYEYINQMRVREACSIIDSMPAENPLSMQSVADMSGFNSISTFNRSFTKTVGMTPSEYARKRSAS